VSCGRPHAQPALPARKGTERAGSSPHVRYELEPADPVTQNLRWSRALGRQSEPYPPSQTTTDPASLLVPVDAVLTEPANPFRQCRNPFGCARVTGCLCECIRPFSTLIATRVDSPAASKPVELGSQHRAFRGSHSPGWPKLMHHREASQSASLSSSTAIWKRTSKRKGRIVGRAASQPCGPA